MNIQEPQSSHRAESYKKVANGHTKYKSVQNQEVCCICSSGQLYKNTAITIAKTNISIKKSNINHQEVLGIHIWWYKIATLVDAGIKLLHYYSVYYILTLNIMIIILTNICINCFYFTFSLFFLFYKFFENSIQYLLTIFTHHHLPPFPLPNFIFFLNKKSNTITLGCVVFHWHWWILM